MVNGLDLLTSNNRPYNIVAGIRSGLEELPPQFANANNAFRRLIFSESAACFIGVEFKMKTALPIVLGLISALAVPLPAIARDHGSRSGWNRGGEWHGDSRHFYGRRFYGYHSPVVLGFGYAPYYYDDYYGSDYNYPYYPRSVYRGREISASDQGSLTADVQEELADRGYYHGEIDGLAGPITRRAIQAYQRDHDLQTTGRIDAGLARSLRLD
jgi:Putative peptidoglycan binding domain